MNKPTIQIDPKSRVLSNAGAVQFAAACVEEAVRLENRGFAGMSLKLYTLNKEEIAEFHWQGMMAIRLIHRPTQDYPAKTYLDFPLFYRGEAQSWGHFRLQDCMIDVIDRRIKNLLDLRNSVANDAGGKNLALMLNQIRPDLYR